MAGSRAPLLAAALLALAACPVAAQEDPASDQPLRVYLDCQTRALDQDFFRVQLDWVSWVRDRQASDVQVIITSQGAGGGGRRYTLEFLGRDAFEGRRVSSSSTPPPTPPTTRCAGGSPTASGWGSSPTRCPRHRPTASR